MDATVELTAYTGVAAFNIGFGARTCCSSFVISGSMQRDVIIQSSTDSMDKLLCEEVDATPLVKRSTAVKRCG